MQVSCSVCVLLPELGGCRPLSVDAMGIDYKHPECLSVDVRDKVPWDDAERTVCGDGCQHALMEKNVVGGRSEHVLVQARAPRLPGPA
jgi:hypothetical protein